MKLWAGVRIQASPEFRFVAVNFQKVKIDFVVGSTEAPLVIALLISGGIGLLIGLVLPHFRGKRDD